MEQANARVTEAVNKMVEEIDRDCLRKKQIAMFKCNVECCENTNFSMHQVQQCIQNCSTPMQSADQYITSEMQAFQDRLQRCAMDCKDKANDTLGVNSTEKDRQMAQVAMEKCIVKCVDDHLQLLPSLTKKIKQTLNK